MALENYFSSVFEQIALKLKDTDETSDAMKMENCFTAFDKDRDDLLSLVEFGVLCKALFHDSNGRPYNLQSETVHEMFSTFDRDKDGFLDGNEFKYCWKHWIKMIVRPVSALIVVDVQNDFISGNLSIAAGSAGQRGEEVVPVINSLLTDVPFDVVVYTMDWHPSTHVSFAENVTSRKLHSSSKISIEQAKVYDTVVFEGPPVCEQKLWPNHCLQDSWGAELHKDLTIAEDAIVIRKGQDPDIDSYSGFWDNLKASQTGMESHLQKHRVTDIFVCGIAYDVCVGSTVVDALDAGYRTVLVEDACRGLDENDIRNVREAILQEHGLALQSTEVKAMVQGQDRRPQLGVKVAQDIRKSLGSDHSVLEEL